MQLLSRAPHLFPVLGEGRVGPKTQSQVHSTHTLSAVSVSWGLPSSYLQAIFSIHSLNNLLEGAGEACDPTRFFPSLDWEPSTLGGFSPEVRTAGSGARQPRQPRLLYYPQSGRAIAVSGCCDPVAQRSQSCVSLPAGSPCCLHSLQRLHLVN